MLVAGGLPADARAAFAHKYQVTLTKCNEMHMELRTLASCSPRQRNNPAAAAIDGPAVSKPESAAPGSRIAATRKRVVDTIHAASFFVRHYDSVAKDALIQSCEPVSPPAPRPIYKRAPHSQHMHTHA